MMRATADTAVRLDRTGAGPRNAVRLAPSALALAAIAVLAGCAAGPNFVAPAKPAVTGYLHDALPAQTSQAPVKEGEAQRFLPSAAIPEQWWTLFQSPALNALIERSLKQNPTVQAAEASLRVAQENVYAQQGAYFPSVSANFAPTRQKVGINTVTSPLTSGDSIFNLHTAQLNVGYTFDVFGTNRRTIEGLQAQTDSQRYQLEAARLSLSSNIVVAAVPEASLRAQITATVALADLQAQQLDLLRRQLKSGAIPEAGVIAQEAAVAQTRALLPPLRKQLAQQRDLLVALAGELPSESSLATFELTTLQLPLELPLGVPSALVEQRPDVRSAEEQLHAASAEVGVATAALLPQFTLGANYGGVATTVSQLFKSGNLFWNLAGGVTQPLFDGGMLLHRKRAAEANYEAAAAQYRSTVIGAFQNVADALQALEFDADATREAVAAEVSAASSLKIARRQLELGDISTVALLAADQTYQQAVIGLVQAKANRFADTAALFQALGGGWWNRPSTSADAAAPLTTPVASAR